jgi:protein-S-isoprenylcysteine O-methyltransferase Ste14
MEENKGENPYKDKVHVILAHSYSVFFFLFLIGIFLDFIFPLKIFQSVVFILVGASLLIFASGLIFWAQKTSRNLSKENLSRRTFSRGPYRLTRSPTHWALLLLLGGFGLMVNATFIVLSALLSFLVTKLVFLPEEESILLKKYGTPYLEYKRSVRL